MKKEFKNFGNRRLIEIIICLAVIVIQMSCLQDLNSNKTFNHTDTFDMNLNNGFINDKYLVEKPLAAIVGVSTYEEHEVPFQLTNESNLQIYGVGETGVTYMDVPSQYLFKSDDIELYFDFPNTESDIIMNQEGHFAYNFSWLDGNAKSNRIFFSKQGAEYYGYYDTLTNGYVAEIKFPWKVFNIPQMEKDTTVGFEITVGDNDEGLMQSGKLAWHSRFDNLMTTTKNYGKLLITKTVHKNNSSDTVFSFYARPTMDGCIDSLWNRVALYKLTNTIVGESMNAKDLSADFKTCWDNQNLYFLINIPDQAKKITKSKGIRKLQTLSDFGWIEDESGNKVWAMHLRDAQFAGGAQKNIKIDQIAQLKAGKYKLKYFSDESHGWRNWDDVAPTTPFYGIIIYQCK